MATFRLFIYIAYHVFLTQGRRSTEIITQFYLCPKRKINFLLWGFPSKILHDARVWIHLNAYDFTTAKYDHSTLRKIASSVTKNNVIFRIDIFNVKMSNTQFFH